MRRPRENPMPEKGRGRGKVEEGNLEVGLGWRDRKWKRRAKNKTESKAKNGGITAPRRTCEVAVFFQDGSSEQRTLDR